VELARDRWEALESFRGRVLLRGDLFDSNSVSFSGTVEDFRLGGSAEPFCVLLSFFWGVLAGEVRVEAEPTATFSMWVLDRVL